MWRIRKDGGLAHRGDADAEDALVVDAIPAVVIRVAVVTVATWLAVTVLAMLIPSPLEEAANPLVTPNPAKAPWYFLWLQEIVADTTVRLGPAHHQRRASSAARAAGGPAGADDAVALARPLAGEHRRRVAAARAADAGPRVRRDRRRRRRADGRRPAARDRRGTSSGRGSRGPTCRRGSEMAKVKRAPEASSPGRARPVVLACLAVLLAAATGWLIFGESSPEYRGHQRRSARPSGSGSGDAAVATVPPGIQQIWIPQTATANRCVTCHLATTWRGFETAAEPLRTHPAGDPARRTPSSGSAARVCHGGQGWAVDRERAHGRVPYWHDRCSTRRSPSAWCPAPAAPR